MAEFFNVLPPDAARDLLFQHLTPINEKEIIATEYAEGRVTAAEIFSPQSGARTLKGRHVPKAGFESNAG